jgi:hypothetical protein
VIDGVRPELLDNLDGRELARGDSSGTIADIRPILGTRDAEGTPLAITPNDRIMAKLRDNFSLQYGLFKSDGRSDPLRFTFPENLLVNVTFESDLSISNQQIAVVSLFGGEDRYNLVAPLPLQEFEDGEEIRVTIDAIDPAGNALSVTEQIVIRYHLDASGQLVVDLMCYPNPFTPLGWAGNADQNQTTIRYVLGRDASGVRLKIYSSYGELIFSKVLDGRSQGEHLFPWSGLDFYGSPLSSGVYFCVLEADGGQGSEIGKFKIAIANSLRR